MDLTVASTVWEKDYRAILQTEYVEKLLLKKFGDKIIRRTLFINNVDNVDNAVFLCEKNIAAGILSDCYEINKIADDVLQKNWGGISRGLFMRKASIKESLDGVVNRHKLKRWYDGYFYSIGPLCAIAECSTEWLLYFTGDALLDENAEYRQIEEMIYAMKEDESFIVANPLWNNALEEAESHSDGKIGRLLIGNGFSDQCFLINAERGRNICFSERNAVSEALYPYYGGNSFERCFNAYMRNHNFKRLTHMDCIYWHEDFTDEIIQKMYMENEKLLSD